MSNNKNKKILLNITYQGTAYKGWQKQSDTNMTVQSQLELALKKRSGQTIKTLASGRTDAGVHARMQAVSFDYYGDRVIGLEDWVTGLNVFLPEDIKVRSAQYVGENFHPIAEVKQKSYRYFFKVGKKNNIFLRECVTLFPDDVEIDLIKKAMQLFKGKHDFKSFQTSNDPQKTTQREIFSITLKKVGKSGIYYLEIIGSGFLKHMVRNIMGALIAVARRKATQKDIRAALKSTQKIKIGSTAPPEGLFLWDILY
ncbi:MAG TPA: tRNA pseudouridine(38-40) synthase TruA [Oligoflexia bacterium]|nr:tRNA pseudouridine(38-40) synthase TruA [Oligoflexia bacterium]HMR23739.1 tRNA pseudouridine(38-40) synthase TruA [Oligoflexia bacterium]